MKLRKLLRTASEAVTKLIFIAAGIIICAPVFLVVTGSVMGKGICTSVWHPCLNMGQDLYHGN